MNHLLDRRRHNLITASNAYSVIHDRPKLWRQMTLREAPFEGNEATEWGNNHEHIALSNLEKELNDIVETGNQLVVHQTLPFGASPDGYYNTFPVEIKCPYSGVIPNEIPDRYYFQVQLQMTVLQKKKCYFYTWTIEKTKLIIVDFNQQWLDWYLPYALEFMKYLESDKEPPRWNKKPIFTKE